MKSVHFGVILTILITARKRSLGQGNVFTPVSFCSRGGGGGGWQTPLSDTTGYGQQAGGTHPTGMHSCSDMF